MCDPETVRAEWAAFNRSRRVIGMFKVKHRIVHWSCVCTEQPRHWTRCKRGISEKDPELYSIDAVGRQKIGTQFAKNETGKTNLNDDNAGQLLLSKWVRCTYGSTDKFNLNELDLHDQVPVIEQH